MQALKVADGRMIDYTPGAAVAAGKVVLQSTMYGVAPEPIVISTLGALATEGTFDFEHIADIVTAGLLMYWDPTGTVIGGAATGGATITAGGLVAIGIATVAAANTVTPVRIKMMDLPAVAGISYSWLNGAIADPGDGLAIAVTASGYVPLVSGGVETRTLADPTFVGQEIQLHHKTDGGSIEVTVATAFNQAGNDTITFTDVGEHCRLQAIEIASALVWRLTSNDGTTLS